MKIGIVLAGGLAKGAFQYGFFKSITSYFSREEITYISGSSIGAITGMAYSIESMDIMEKIWRTSHFDNPLKLTFSIVFKQFINKQVDLLIGQRPTFDIPLYANICLFPILDTRYYKFFGKFTKNRKIKNFFKASVGFPVLTGFPKFFRGRLAADGGFGDNIPVYPLVTQHMDELDYIFILHFDHKYRINLDWEVKYPNKLISIYLADHSPMELMSFDFDTRTLNELLDQGEKAGNRFLDQITNHKKDYSNLYEKYVEYIKDLEKNRKYELDRLPSICNFFTQPLRRKNCVYTFTQKHQKLKNHNLLDYVLFYGDDDFDKKPFSVEDSIVFSLLSYLYFERVLADDDIQTLSSLQDKLELISKGSLYQKKHTELFNYVIKSERYKNVKVTNPCSETNQLDYNFFAITFILDENNSYVAFRGTTTEVSDWIEDLNMTVLDEIPSQLSAKNYLEKMMGKITHQIYVGGHSKGGNLAVYAAINQKEIYQDRIVQVYDHDGPGFKHDIFKTTKNKEILEKIDKTIPQYEIVGQLLTKHSHPQIIESKQFSVFQHNLYNWRFSYGHLLTREKVNKHNKKDMEVLRNWLNQLSDEEKKAFILFLTNLLGDAKIDNFKVILRHPFQTIHYLTLSETLRNQNKRREINRMIVLLFRMYLTNMKKRYIG